MKLLNLKIAGIRGFNDEQTLDFDGKLVIYSGPNAAGKTNIGEAIEWLLYGKTLKRVKGDEISKREYEGSYRNTHYSLTADPFVEATIEDSANKKRVILRRLEVDESSTLTVDGEPAIDLQEFGIGALYDRPLILQHTLQDFIFMRPKTRYEVLSAMLGLEPLVDFRNAVEDAKTDFQNPLPAKIVESQNRAALLSAAFRRYSLLTPVADAIQRGKLKAAREQFVQIAHGRVPAGTPETRILDTLQETKAAKERARLDWGRFSLNPVGQPESHPAVKNLETIERRIDEFASNLAEAAKQTDEATFDAVPDERRQFYRQGLSLRNDDRPTECPFCLEDSLTPERIAQLQKQAQPLPAAKTHISAARQAIVSLRSALTQQWASAHNLLPSLPNQDERSVIEELTRDAETERREYLSSCDTVSASSTGLQALKKALEDSINATEAALEQGIQPPQHVSSVSGEFESYKKAVRELPGITNGYSAHYSKLDPTVKGKLASADEIKFLQVLIEGIRDWNDLIVSWQVEQTSSELQDLVRESRKFIEIKQKQILGQRDQEIRSWYQLLTGSVSVGYAGMDPSTDNLELKARTFTKGMMAAPNLSSSQLNCVGLAVYMATCCRSGSPFRLILFDDPIQSMDDEHTEAFKKQVISKLLGRGLQVVLLTHMDKFADAVERLYRAEEPLFYKLDDYRLSGPSVEWKGPEIKRLLCEIRKDKDASNTGHRKRAVQALRQFVERFVKDFFEADTGRSIAKKYEDKTWPDLRQLLRQCPSFDVVHEPELEDTYNFTSPYIHTDEGLPQEVPNPHQLNPHYLSMKNLLEKYADLLRLP